VTLEATAAAHRAVLGSLEHTEQLADATHEQTLLVDLDPCTSRCREHNVIAGLDRHPDANVVPPVKARADREHDPVLGWRLIGARRDEQTRAPDAIRVEFLDHDTIEEGAELVTHSRLPMLGGELHNEVRALGVGLQSVEDDDVGGLGGSRRPHTGSVAATA
jgi:hypothetical protein